MAHHRTHSRSMSSADALARGLGWFSIGLGILEVAAPHRLTRALGMRGQENIIRAYGWREIANGVGILAARDPAPWVWGRVGGDALDLATLAGGFDENNRRRENVGLAMAAVAGVTALDVYCATAFRRTGTSRRGGNPSATTRCAAGSRAPGADARRRLRFRDAAGHALRPADTAARAGATGHGRPNLNAVIGCVRRRHENRRRLRGRGSGTAPGRYWTSSSLGAYCHPLFRNGSNDRRRDRGPSTHQGVGRCTILNS